MMKKTNEKKIVNKCQIFTPTNYVKELLDSVGYHKNIVNRTILENSCGDGNILVEIVNRYIEEAIELKFSNKKIKKGLENNIFGFEIDKNQFEKCICNLNLLVKKNGIQDVEWKIYNEDYLKSEINIQFDFIVGNPPYITYSNLSQEERTFIKDKYETCRQGKFDYCYAFIEHSIKSLSSEGKMSYLIPSSIFKTVFGNKLREFMVEYIVEIKDYTKEKIFDNALVKSAIIIVDKKDCSEKIKYMNMSNDKLVNEIKLFKQDSKKFKQEKTNVEARYKYDVRILNALATSGMKATSIAHEINNDRNQMEPSYNL